MTRETVLLECSGGPVVFDVPEGASACRVPNDTAIPLAAIRGATFERTGRHHELFYLPTFRRAAYQV